VEVPDLGLVDEVVVVAVEVDAVRDRRAVTDR